MTLIPRRMASLAIGVSKAERLPYLRGALNGAVDFHKWASAAGYESEVLTDEGEGQVTIPVLRQKLEDMLRPKDASGPSIYRFMLYFAGHGVIRDANASLWLLSDWFSEWRAVNVEQLKRRLGWYGVSQISIFADACKKFPANIDTGDINEDSVLGRGPQQPPYPPYIDAFDAVQDGNPAIMIPGCSENEDRCLFTGVLMEGLWGSPSALSDLVPGKVTSHSLDRFLRDEVPRRAATYQRRVLPNTKPMFPPDAAVYFCDVQPPPSPPAFQPWPDPSQVLGATAQGGEPRPDSTLSDLTSLGDRYTNPSVEFEDATEPLENFILGGSPRAPTTPPPPAPYPDHVAAFKRRIEIQQVPPSFETGSGFAVASAEIRALWTPPGIFAGVKDRRDWWHVGEDALHWMSKPSPVLIELRDGRFLAQVALPNFVTSIVCTPDRGASALVYRINNPQNDSGEKTLRIAASAIAEMESGSLRANAIADLTVELRQFKHVDPTLGVINAYLYDSIGDLDSIRRMAYFYTIEYQAIPYDIALLAQAYAWRSPEDGVLHLRVPPVGKSAPRTNLEQKYDWTWMPTPEVEGTVGGLWPWMRQGWAFLEDPTDMEMGLVDPFIASLRSQLTSARFSTLNSQGGRQLAAYLNMVEHTGA
jgi:hypothetical protein